MRIYSSSYELMSEMGRELNSYGQTVKPKTYQNKGETVRSKRKWCDICNAQFHSLTVVLTVEFIIISHIASSR